jgi:hypothetical protein
MVSEPVGVVWDLKQNLSNVQCISEHQESGYLNWFFCWFPGVVVEVKVLTLGTNQGGSAREVHAIMYCIEKARQSKYEEPPACTVPAKNIGIILDGCYHQHYTLSRKNGLHMKYLNMYWLTKPTHRIRQTLTYWSSVNCRWLKVDHFPTNLPRILSFGGKYSGI